MKIDLHLHTWPKSQCSTIEPADLIKEAEKIGLDAICITEHQVLWSQADADALADSSAVKIFYANEITTAQGDVLVYGLEKDIQGIITIQELEQEVKAAGAFSVLAHPFRGFKTFGISDLQMSVEQAAKKKALQFVDAIEIRNGKVTDNDNQMAEKVAEKLKMPGTGGSDAHVLDDVGRFITIFEDDIAHGKELVEALRSGAYTVGTCR